MTVNLGVLPWIGLDTTVHIGRVTFVPWSKYKEKVADVDLREHINTYLGIYKGKSFWQGNWSEVHPMIGLLDDSLHIPKEDVDVFFRTVHMLFFLMTSWDNLTYINSNSVEAFVQPLEVGKYTLGYGPRRGMTLCGDFRDLIFTEPLHVSGVTRALGFAQFDEYRDALGKLQSSKDWGALADAALHFYRLTYDDDQSSNDYLKISYIISATETLLECGRDDVLKEVAKHVPSKKPGVIYNRKTKTDEPSTLPAEVMDRAYKSRNGYLHAGATRGISLMVDGEEIPLWDCAVHTFQKLFISKLDEWGMVQWGPGMRYILLTSRFDDEIESIVEKAKSHREWQEKEAKKSKMDA